jgi:hypothetical protein
LDDVEPDRQVVEDELARLAGRVRDAAGDRQFGVNDDLPPIFD